jgi:preprotein translocase subunit SecA
LSVFNKILRAGEGKRVRQLSELVAPINALEEEIAKLSDEELAAKTVEFKQRLSDGEDLDDLMIEAYAVVREAASRVLGQRHYDEQLMGGMALHFGWIAEMKTGEGKTLVSTLPVYLNALAGQGVHVVTVNDYLATRDSEWMGRVYKFLGLTVGRVGADRASFELKLEAYNSDITYGTNTEFGFDYLRDNMARQKEHIVQRGHHFAIVDEVDSILIDEARTPLIISGVSSDSVETYQRFSGIARTLVRDTDYEVDEEKQAVLVTLEGIAKVEKALGVENLYDATTGDFVHHLEQALRAKELYTRDKDYIVEGGEIKIVDEFTGRTLEGRRWSEGLHQAVEAKERVKVMDENHTWATVTLQNYFRLYEKLGGMTGTAETEAGEFAGTYNLSVVPIPTHRPNIRIDHEDLIYKTEESKFKAIVEEVKERNEKGQPVLLGTASVEKSETLSQALNKAGITHEVLNAKQHFREAEIVTQAGRKGVVTVATNMAGRGVDIILGGNAEGLAGHEAFVSAGEVGSEAYEEAYQAALAKWKPLCEAEGDEVRAAGGLYVLGTERHDSRRIDNQLRGRSGRQGDPGETRFYLSLEDELMRVFATGAVSWVMERTIEDDKAIEAKMVTKAIERAQSTVEGKNGEIRKDVLKYDDVMNEQRKVLYARRQNILNEEDMHDEVLGLIEQILVEVVDEQIGDGFVEEWNIAGLHALLLTYYPTEMTIEDLEGFEDKDTLIDAVVAEALALYQTRGEGLNGGMTTMRFIERDLMLQLLDQQWREHLSDMDRLRDGIHLRQVANTDPLSAWQREGYWAFEKMIARVDKDFVRNITHVQLTQAEPTATEADSGLAGITTNVRDVAPEEVDEAAPERAKATPVTRDRPKIGRNEPCWCGSGKKYKMCHGRAGAA